MRIVFMGTPEFAVPSLQTLLNHHYTIPAVVTAPDKPQGRGQKASSSPVKRFALEQSLNILQPPDLKAPSFSAEIAGLKPDLIVVVAFRILPASVYSIPSKGAFNLHASLLPKYRGAAPINWALIRGEQETGVTTFFLKETVDTGSIVLQARIRIGPDETAGELHDRLAEIGAEIVLQTVRLIESGRAKLQTQDDTMATPAPKIFTNDCRIDWNLKAHEIHNFVRGLSPIPGAWTLFKGKTVKIFRTRHFTESNHKVVASGTIVKVDRETLIVKAAEGAITILEIQIEGKKRMNVAEFLRGFPMETGDRFDA